MLVAIGGVRYLPDEPEEPEGLLTALTTEHFTLQGARSATTSESSARTALYLGAVSSVLISIGFVSGDSALLPVFTLVVLPTVFLLGIATFVRLVELGVEDFIYGRAINRIRAHYRQLAGPYARLFLLRGNDDALGVMRNMGLRRAGSSFCSPSLLRSPWSTASSAVRRSPPSCASWASRSVLPWRLAVCLRFLFLACTYGINSTARTGRVVSTRCYSPVRGTTIHRRSRE